MEWVGPPDGHGGGMRLTQESSICPVALLKLSAYANRTVQSIIRRGFVGRTVSPFSMVLLIVLGACVVATAQEEERTAVEPAMARKAATLILARCAVCHSTDLIAQQRLPQDRWMVTVEKMVHWGAELSPDDASLVVQYLTARNHPGAPDQLPSIEAELATMEPSRAQSVLTDGPLTGVAARGAGLFAHNCQACHGEGGVGGAGPKLARTTILKNEGAFWETVLHGRGPMPAWGAVLTHQEIADIHAWLVTR